MTPSAPSLRATLVIQVDGLEPAAGVPAGNFPPYDLLRVPGGLRLVFAVAGYGPEQLEITVGEDQILVSGAGAGDGDPGRFLHRGIAARRFRRVFRLAPGLDVLGAELDRGLLSIALACRPAERAARRIGIGSRNP